MEYQATVNGAVLTIHLSGDILGQSSTVDLFDYLNGKLDEGLSQVVLDMAKLRYINSTGLGLIITMYTKIKNKSGKLVLLSPSKPVEGLIHSTKLDQVLTVAHNDREADKILNSTI